MRVETININTGATTFEYVSNDHKLSCRACFNSFGLSKLGLRSCEKNEAHFFVEKKEGDDIHLNAFCLPGLKRAKHAKQVAKLLSAGLCTIQEMREQRKQVIATASSIAVHNTRNITASINSKLLGLIDETRLASSKNKTDYIEELLRYRSQEFARELLSILKAITQANFEYTVLDYLTGTRPLTQQDFGNHKVHTLCTLCFYLYDAEFDNKYIKVPIGTSHQTCCVNFSSIKTVIGQLFENALKYMKQGSELNVSFLSEDKNTISIKLCMSSLAFKNVEIPRMLSFGKRGENADKHGYKGKGMGLAMAHELVRLNHGTLEIEVDESSYHLVNGIPYTTNTFCVNLLRNKNHVIEKIKKTRTTNRFE